MKLLHDTKSEVLIIVNTIKNDRIVIVLVYCLLALTMLLLALYAFFSFNNSWVYAEQLAYEFNPERESSITSVYGLSVLFLAAMFFLIYFLDNRSWMALFLFCLYGFIWFDDLFQFHERFGAWLVLNFDIQSNFGLRAQDYGELLAWAIAGVALLFVFPWIWGVRRPGDLGVVFATGMCFGLLVAFGVILDMIHVFVQSESMSFMIGLFEDGGEILSILLAAMLALGLSRNHLQYYDNINQHYAELSSRKILEQETS